MTSVHYATAADLALWRDIRLRALAESPDAYCSTLERELAFTEAEWVERLAPPAVLALEDDRPVAMGAGFRTGPQSLTLVAMWVDPARRREGLSRQVLDLLVAWARERRLDIDLTVVRGNPAARSAYEQYGFVATGESEPLREGSALLMDRMVLARSTPGTTEPA